MTGELLLYQRESLGRLLNPIALAARLWRLRSLIIGFARRQLEVRHRGSHLGWVWPVLSPLLLLGIYGFVFMFVFDGRYGLRGDETRVDFAIGVFLSLSLMQLYIEVLHQSTAVITANPNYVKKVVFPLDVLPAAVVGAATVQCGVALMLAALAALVLGVQVTVTAWWLLVLMVPLLAFSLGTAWILAALGVFFRDVQHLVQVLALLLMFFSAVFYPASRIPEAFWVVKLNPFLHLMEAARGAVLAGARPDAVLLFVLYVLGLLVCVGGFAFFKRAQPAFPDLL
jgi:lipopolysaccharide transport system permease protein